MQKRSNVENAEEKVWRYLVEHKTPVLAATLAKRFMFSQSHVARILRDLEQAGNVEAVRIGSQKFYRVKQ
jgi:uncharacterized membrane protein